VIILPLALLAADFVGTRYEVEPVTQQHRVMFAVQQDDRTLMMGCGDKGSGELTIAIQPRTFERPIDDIIRGFRERFRQDPDDNRGPWTVRGENIRFDDAKFGSSKAKAAWINRFANDTAYYVRFQTDDGPVSASFEYGGAAKAEIRKMLHACKPKKVLEELGKIGSDLATPPPSEDAAIPSL
jgi:hypothetical protein